jgi:hypothetical protein
MNWNYFFYILLLIFVSCEPISTNHVSEPICEIEYSVLNKGDGSDYQTLLTYYLDYYHTFESVYFSTIMANKYNYEAAYFFVYFELMNLNLYRFDGKANSITDIAVLYLKTGMEKGDYQASYKYGCLLVDGIFVQKDSLKGEKLIEYGKQRFGK